jgi:hypothetical protein
MSVRVQTSEEAILFIEKIDNANIGEVSLDDTELPPDRSLDNF